MIQNMITDDHFLRPAQTKLVIQRLQRGDSINLFGKTGIGKTRLLEDIRKSGLENTHIIHISFQGYQNSYEGFSRAIRSEFGIEENFSTSLDGTIEEMQKKEKQNFILIDDFQYLPENPDIDPAYNQQFIDNLNSIKNASNVSLLVVTQKPVNNLIIFINKQPVTSVLNLDFVEVFPLQHEEIRNELDRRFEQDILNEQQKILLCSHLNEQTNNYELLKYYEVKILTKADVATDFSRRLNKWQHESKKKKRPTGIKKFVLIKSKLNMIWTLINKKRLPKREYAQTASVLLILAPVIGGSLIGYFLYPYIGGVLTGAVIGAIIATKARRIDKDD
ncbi:MAG: ATP-binding protein [Desulfobacteraceae bacterium]|nr:ATP-binding protein [Desulfobacteraceae bacterium]